MNAYAAYAVVACAGGLSSVLVVLVSFKTLSQITNTGMFAITFMAFAPAVMASIIAICIHRSHAARPGQGQRLWSPEPLTRDAPPRGEDENHTRPR